MEAQFRRWFTRLLTKQDLAQRYGCTIRCINLWMQNGRLPEPIRMGPCIVRWEVDEILRWERMLTKHYEKRLAGNSLQP